MNELTRAYMKLKQTLPTRENIVSKKQILDQVTIILIFISTGLSLHNMAETLKIMSSSNTWL